MLNHRYVQICFEDEKGILLETVFVNSNQTTNILTSLKILQNRFKKFQCFFLLNL